VKFSLVLTLALILSALPFARPARADAASNKALFDRTVDRLNFQTMEGVYDARFARKKFPVNLKTRLERRNFKEFNGDEAFEKLFLNYNDEAEKYKSRFGTGVATLATFDKALRSILVDANFEFFLAKASRREDRAALIRKLESSIKQAVTQYDASGEAPSEAPRPDTLAGATVDDDAAPPVSEASDDQVAELNEAATGEPETPAPADQPATNGGGWGGTLALVLAVGAALGVGYLLFVVVPALRAQTQHAIDSQQAVQAERPAAPDDHLPPTLAEEARHRAVELRFELLADELDEFKSRLHEVENRLAVALAAPPENKVFASAPLPEAVPPVGITATTPTDVAAYALPDEQSNPTAQ
jgi:hypothetical protein